MADEEVTEEQPQVTDADAEQAVDTATETEAEPSAEADAATETPADESTEAVDGAPQAAAGGGDAEATDGDEAEVAIPSVGQEAIDAVENIENQLGEVLSGLDGLADPSAGFGSLSGAASQFGGTEAGIDLLRDVQLNVKIELGRSPMYIEDILRLGEGHVVELDKLAGDPVDVLVNERLVARGEVLVLNDNFCVRIGEIIPQD